MKRVLVFLVLCVLVVGMFGGNTGQAAAASPRDTVLVKFRAGVSQAEKGALHSQRGGVVRGTISGIDVEVVTVPAGRAESAAASYAKDRRVRYAEVDHEASAVSSVNDYYFVKGYQWALTKIQAPQAWDLTTGCSTISIAVLDTGVDMSHPDLSGKVVGNVNYSSSGTVSDVYGHGTHVAGIAAAATNNGQGVAGLGYNSAILNVKVLGDDGAGTYSAVAYGIVWAADHGARVINMSLGGTSLSSTLQDAVNYAWGKGVVLVAAAGNNGNNVPFYPAYFQNVIAVASTDSTDSLTPYSDRGDWVDVAAPGDSIWSTRPNNSYGSMSGTSMASPHVAGLAALVVTRVGDTNGNGFLNDEVRACIQNNADNIGVSGIGSGRINAYKAVQATSPAPPTTGSTTGTVTDAVTGAAIVGATVTDGTRSATSDANGGYTIANVPGGTYTVTATASGYDSASQSVQVTAGQTSTADFALSPLPGAIAGTVTDAATGATIAGATVTDGTRSATSDANGGYSIANVPAGTYTVTATASGYNSASQSVQVTAGQTSTANFVLSPPPAPGAIAGTVKDAATGATIAGATVTDGTRSATSNANGGYSIASVPAGTYTVTATASGYNSASQSVQVTAGQTSTANFVLSAPPPPGAIAGTVRDAATGATIAGATVKVGVASTTTDASGQYVLSDLTEGSYTETVSASGYADVSQSVSVVTGQTTVVNVNLPPNTMWVDSISFKQSGGNLRIEVKVVNAKAAMSGVKVTVYVSGPVGKTWTLSGSTSTNGIATFMVQKASRGTYLVTVTRVYAGVNYWDMTKGVNSASYTVK